MIFFFNNEDYTGEAKVLAAKACFNKRVAEFEKSFKPIDFDDMFLPDDHPAVLEYISKVDQKQLSTKVTSDTIS
eukprot:6492672-Amphidinium_carterae.5